MLGFITCIEPVRFNINNNKKVHNIITSAITEI